MNQWKTDKCPYCGSSNFVSGYQMGQGSLMTNKMGISGSRIEHLICKDCNMIIGSRVEKTSGFKAVSK